MDITVVKQEMIDELQKNEDGTIISFRKSHGDGYYSDHEVELNEFYPSGNISITFGKTIDSCESNASIVEKI